MIWYNTTLFVNYSKYCWIYTTHINKIQFYYRHQMLRTLSWYVDNRPPEILTSRTMCIKWNFASDLENPFQWMIRNISVAVSRHYVLLCKENMSMSKLLDIIVLIVGPYVYWFYMMMSSNGNIFRVTGPLCGEFTGHRCIPLTKASDAEVWCFLWYAPE